MFGLMVQGSGPGIQRVVFFQGFKGFGKFSG